MRQIVCFIKAMLFTLSILTIPAVINAQSLPIPQEVQTPNAATMQKFTDIPVSLFTGTPQIKIPIYNMHYGSIDVPIALSYHPGAVKVNQVPGWVGMGWNLEAYGVITRRTNGIPDDAWGTLSTSIGPEDPYYPMANSSTLFPIGQGGDIINGQTGWDTPGQLVADYTTLVTGGSYSVDLEADEFSFNVMGHSGTFYYSGSALGWQVVSDENIKITMNGLLYYQDVINAIKEFTPTQNQYIDPEFQANIFAGFTLTMPDGTQYVFGGKEAIEFNSPYGPATVAANHFTETSWLLTKIIDPNNNEVDFTYQRNYPTLSLSFGGSDLSITTSRQPLTGSVYSSPCSFTQDAYTGNTAVHSASLQWPMYLSQIKSPNETVTFTIGNVNELRYPATEMQLINTQGPNNAGSTNLFNTTLIQNVGNIQWEQLNNIVITNSNNNIYRQFLLAYSNSPTQRSTLNGLLEYGNVIGQPIAQYTFAYNNPSLLPLYEGDYADHWGFYNGSTINGANMLNVTNIKQTNATLVTTGLLSQITFPTKGYVQFTWEAHDYQQVVAPGGRQMLNNVSLSYAGGSRIREIKSFDRDNTVLLDKKYCYKRNYTAGADISNLSPLTSSGILNGTPQYILSGMNRPSLDGTYNATLYTEGINSLTNYSYNSNDSYIGYDEVAEINADGSYTKHFFTSYGADLNNVTHWDITPGAYTGWLANQDYYFPMSTLELERGKETGEFDYTNANTLVKKSLTSYRTDAARFNSFIRKIDFNHLSLPCATAYDAIFFTVAKKIFSYDYYPVSNTVTTYDQLGNNPSFTTESYAYNTNNLITKKTSVNSRGETIVKTYKYPTDFNDQASQGMTTAHIISPIIESSESNNGNPVNLVHTDYTTSSGQFVPQDIQTQTSSNAEEFRRQFSNYDGHGNAQEMWVTNDSHDVTLYGYNAAYVVAKITNATFAQVQQVMAANNITQGQLDNAATMTDSQLRALLNLLRTNLPNSLLTTYTYSPVFGMTSMTDPKGNILFYEYDTFGRLMNIKDVHNKIVKHTDYVIQ